MLRFKPATGSMQLKLSTTNSYLHIDQFSICIINPERVFPCRYFTTHYGTFNAVNAFNACLIRGSQTGISIMQL